MTKKQTTKTKKTTTAKPAAITTKAMLVDVNISHWTARVKDNEATQEIHTSKGAADIGNYRKLIIPKSALEPVERLVSRARNRHLELTQPWIDKGARILSAHVFVRYMHEMGEIEKDFEIAADRFVKGYEQSIEDHRQAMGDLFKADDYPPASTLREKFSFAITPTPFPDSKDFRVALSESHANAMRREIERSVRDATANAMRDAYSRITATVTIMAEKLRAYKPAVGSEKATGVFRDTLVANVADLVDLLKGFNLTGDPKMTKMTKEIETALLKHDAEQLREDDGLRKSVSVIADDIARRAAELMA
jgi:hypothetical protein